MVAPTETIDSVRWVTRESFSFDAEVWEHHGQGAWHFVSLPEPIADDIEAEYGHRAKGFGSLRVEVSIGATRWRTSIFPDNKRATYLLPVKKAVRSAKDLSAGSVAQVELRLLD